MSSAKFNRPIPGWSQFAIVGGQLWVSVRGQEWRRFDRSLTMSNLLPVPHGPEESAQL